MKSEAIVKNGLVKIVLIPENDNELDIVENLFYDRDYYKVETILEGEGKDNNWNHRLSVIMQKDK